MATSNTNFSLHRKLALIIGNQNYSQHQNTLNHPVNNARDLSNLLKTIDFHVVSGYNLSNEEMNRQIAEFSKAIRNGDLVLFYFSGYGNQVNSENYLIPTNDAKIIKDRDFEDFAVKYEEILARLVNKNPSYVTIVILDCGRPYVLKNETASNCKWHD
jgi:uncharacterized caspase-like protein